MSILDANNMANPSAKNTSGSSSSIVGDEEFDSCSIISFDSSRTHGSSSSAYQIGSYYSEHCHGVSTPSFGEIKVETVYSLLSMLNCNNNIKEEMCHKFYLMSLDAKISSEMRANGCMPLLISLIHPSNGSNSNSSSASFSKQQQYQQQSKDVQIPGSDYHSPPPSSSFSSFSSSDFCSSPASDNLKDMSIRSKACTALRNIIRHTEETKDGAREMKVLHLLEEIREFCDKFRRHSIGALGSDAIDTVNMSHPSDAASQLMKISFDGEHRISICLLGGLHAIAELVYYDTLYHGNTTSQACITVRRYAFMALTNLTFGDGTNKGILCSNRQFIHSLIQQLNSPSEELRQVTASVLRNLSWKADEQGKNTLREMGSVSVLMRAALRARKESTLKSILSALWNLSAHSTANKVEICNYDGALKFLVSTLQYRSASNSLTIIENGGGILRNISSHIARHENLRTILREHNCLGVLLEQLKSPSLTIVSNACATLWNLSARCPKDQMRLLDLGAVPMLRNLVNSKHKMISMGSVAALKNLSSLRIFREYDSYSSMHNSSSTSSNINGGGGGAGRNSILSARKIPLFRPELDDSLSEICDNTESPKMSPIHGRSSSSSSLKLNFPERIFASFTPPPQNSHQSIMSSSSSKDSLRSTHSEPIFSSTSSNLMTAGYRHLHDYLMSVRDQMEETKENGHQEKNQYDHVRNSTEPDHQNSISGGHLFHAYPIQIDSDQPNDSFVQSESVSNIFHHNQYAKSSNQNHSSIEESHPNFLPLTSSSDSIGNSGFMFIRSPSSALPRLPSIQDFQTFNSSLRRQIFNEIQPNNNNNNNHSLPSSYDDPEANVDLRVSSPIERIIENLESAGTKEEEDENGASQKNSILFTRTDKVPHDYSPRETREDYSIDYEAERDEDIEYFSPETVNLDHNISAIEETVKNMNSSSNYSSIQLMGRNNDDNSNEHDDSLGRSFQNDDDHSNVNKDEIEVYFATSVNKSDNLSEKSGSLTIQDDPNSAHCSLNSKQSENTQEESGFIGSSSRLNDFSEDSERKDDEEDSATFTGPSKPIVISEQLKRRTSSSSSIGKIAINTRRRTFTKYTRNSTETRIPQKQSDREESQVQKQQQQQITNQNRPTFLPTKISKDPKDFAQRTKFLSTNNNTEFSASKERRLQNQNITNIPRKDKLDLAGDIFIENTNPPSDMDAISGISSSCGSSLDSLEFDSDFEVPLVQDLSAEVSRMIKKQTEDIIQLTESHKHDDGNNDEEDPKTFTKSRESCPKPRMVEKHEDVDDSEDDSRATYVCSPKIGPRIVKPVIRSHSVNNVVKKSVKQSDSSSVNSASAATMNKSKSLVIRGTKTTALRANRSRVNPETSNDLQIKQVENAINSSNRKSSKGTDTFVRRKSSNQENIITSSIVRDRSSGSALNKLGSSTSFHSMDEKISLNSPTDEKCGKMLTGKGKGQGSRKSVSQSRNKIGTLWKKSDKSTGWA
ncbi:uncharacterized protein LOC141853090 [Brevipalpus obovatus]|uniref:uncharacterized protein LOC141853090 n=1 Tax=Brevipalpus obovatus TaxID=246614 RepID=UPI003D9EE320